MREACGLFGIYAHTDKVAQVVYYGLHALQHRGQESSGMAVSDGKKITLYKKMGLVSQVYNETILGKLKGKIAIGHNRYGTTGPSSLTNAQPIVLNTNLGTMALAHNGNLVNVGQLKKKLLSKRESFVTNSDSEIIAKLIARAPGKTWETKIIKGIQKLKGAYSLVILNKNSLFGLRDRWGIRPLVLGKYNSGFIFASETAAIDNIGGRVIREVKPGEIIKINKKGYTQVHREKITKTGFCIFEYIYFSRADSTLNGQPVYKTRLNAGKLAAQQHPVKADLVIAVPDSGTSAAIGYSQQSKIPFIEGLIKSRYIGRTFIQPESKIRKLGVRLKFSPVEAVIKGKDIIIVDDSIVRGTTIRGIIKILRKNGAKKIHMRVASPPLVSPCYLGVDISRYSELIASKRSVEEIKNNIGADSLGYLSLEELKKAIGKVDCCFCNGCFTKNYPLLIDKIEKKQKTAEIKNIAVLISNKGTGTNLQALINKIKKGQIKGKIVCVVSDKPAAFGLKRAKKEGIPIEVISLKDLKDKRKRTAYGKKLAKLLKVKYHTDLVVLAGWMLILPESFLDTFQNRVLNLHPGLIADRKGEKVVLSDGRKVESFAGKMANNAIKAAFASKTRISGSTVHFVTKDVDWGPVILRITEKIQKTDTIENYYNRLKLKEHQILCKAVKLFCEDRLKIKDNLVFIKSIKTWENKNSIKEKIKLLIVGGGGREHALAWKLNKSKRVEKIFVAPGNAGTSKFCENISINVEDISGLTKFAENNRINLAIIGPEIPLSKGIVDKFEKKGLCVFGPTKRAAKIESSKVFAKRFMKRFKIPSSDFKVFADHFKALDFIRKTTLPVVIKADGLAAGKGVYVCKTRFEAKNALREIMVDKKFNDAGKKVVIEDCLFGQEMSVICLTDGRRILPLLSAQDHKAVFDNDLGPNTGGMGAYAPTPLMNKKLKKQIINDILKPVVDGLRKSNRLYKGVLYAGIMLTREGPKVLEFNCRFGDPETQPQMMLLKDDLLPLMLDCIKGRLTRKKLFWHSGYSVCVIIASKGYPSTYQKGLQIKELPEKSEDDLQVFHSATIKDSNKILSNGGRVLAITSKGETIQKAVRKAYVWAKKIKLKNKYYRKDIAKKVL